MFYCNPVNRQLANHLVEKWCCDIVVHYCKLTDQFILSFVRLQFIILVIRDEGKENANHVFRGNYVLNCLEICILLQSWGSESDRMKEKLLILIGRIGKEARVGKITTKVQGNVLLYGIFHNHSVCFIIISLNYSLEVTVI